MSIAMKRSVALVLAFLLAGAAVHFLSWRAATLAATRGNEMQQGGTREPLNVGYETQQESAPMRIKIDQQGVPTSQQHFLSENPHQPKSHLPLTLMRFGWPALPFYQACPDGDGVLCSGLLSGPTPRKMADQPEAETREVLTSFLLDIAMSGGKSCCGDGCLYLDIGCNVGFFASIAASYGARVECYEPAPFFVEAMRETVRINGWNVPQSRCGEPPLPLVQVFHNAIVHTEENMQERLVFHGAAYMAGIGQRAGKALKTWKIPKRSIRQLLESRSVKLLKIDIDSFEGGLLHTAVMMLENRTTKIETMVVELGSTNFEHPRGGDVLDLWKLQQQLGYDIYRVNVHVNQEIWNWRGVDLNPSKSSPQEGYTPMFGVRFMRKLEYLEPHADGRRAVWAKLFASPSPYVNRGWSFLITRVRLAERAGHNKMDTRKIQSFPDLNADFPSPDKLDDNLGRGATSVSH